MSCGYSLLKAFSTIGLIMTMGVSLSACGSSEKWKEEVQLSDGRVIVVEREMIGEAGGDEWALNRSGSKPKEYRIQFADSDDSGKKIEWRSTKLSPQTWPEVALILDVESGQPIVFSLAAISANCEIYSKYLYRNGAWVEETLAEKFEQHATNLFLRIGTDMPKFVNLDLKRKINSGAEGRGYRRALTQVGPNRKVCG